MKYLSHLFTMLLMATLIGCGGNEKSEQKESQSIDTETNIKQTISAAANDAKVNINTAAEKAFRAIPGVGDKMVHEFEEYRPYVSIQQFRKEIGKYVDEEKVAAFEKYIYVPVSANESDAASLQQLPGVDADVAQQLVDGRPYDSTDAFVEELSTHINEEQLKTAKTYLKSE